MSKCGCKDKNRTLDPESLTSSDFSILRKIGPSNEISDSSGLPIRIPQSVIKSKHDLKTNFKNRGRYETDDRDFRENIQEYHNKQVSSQQQQGQIDDNIKLNNQLLQNLLIQQNQSVNTRAVAVAVQKQVIGDRSSRIEAEVSPLRPETALELSIIPSFEVRRTNDVVTFQWSNIKGRLAKRTNYVYINQRISILPTSSMIFPFFIEINDITSLSYLEIDTTQGSVVKFYLLQDKSYLDPDAKINIKSSSIHWILE
jgi:hypothetical protein